MCRTRKPLAIIIVKVFVLFQTTGRLMDLPGAVYTIDNNRKGIQPIVSIGSAEYVYLVQAT